MNVKTRLSSRAAYNLHGEFHNYQPPIFSKLSELQDSDLGR